MNTLQKQIEKDLKNTEHKDIKNSLKVVVGELQRQRNKEVPDDEVIKILKKLTKYVDETPEELRTKELLFYREIINTYIPKNDITDEEILDWIKNNVDFTALKNKMQAVGVVMKNFQGKLDGARVKELVTNYET